MFLYAGLIGYIRLLLPLLSMRNKLFLLSDYVPVIQHGNMEHRSAYFVM